MSYDNDISLDDIFELNKEVANETDSIQIIDKFMRLAQQACNSDGVTYYTISNDNFLRLVYSHSRSLKIHKLGSDNKYYTSPTYLPDQKKNPKKTIIITSALNQELINTANIYNDDYDNDIYLKWDEDMNYKTVSMLVIPLFDSRKHIIGIAQFINAMDINGRPITFTAKSQEKAQAVCRLLAPYLENHKLKEDYDQLLESFIEVLARAIDAKSHYTGSHCQRVPVIARMLATAAVQQEHGALKNFEMNENDWYALNIASWLHDCGKVTTPEYIVDKATKLETINNRIHEIRNRFEILRRDAHIDYLKKRLKNAAPQEELQSEYISKIQKLEDDFDFIAKCNIGDIPLSDKDVARLQEISHTKFIRYFSRMKGLSWAERDAVTDVELYSNPSYENLLQNRDDQINAPYNRGELYNLTIRSGTINKKEREKINEHIVVTIDMLKALPFPKELSNVVEYAGAHHERIDGQGYPNGLTREQMSVPARIMAIADIFEALTANDRPYKEPKKLSKVLAIMQHMKNTGHIDPDLYEVFIRSGVYADYAEQYISPAQIDEINPEDFL